MSGISQGNGNPSLSTASSKLPLVKEKMEESIKKASEGVKLQLKSDGSVEEYNLDEDFVLKEQKDGENENSSISERVSQIKKEWDDQKANLSSSEKEKWDQFESAISENADGGEVSSSEEEVSDYDKYHFSVPRIGDVVTLKDGQTYSASSTGGKTGTIGDFYNDICYTIDTIAILDNDGNLLTSFSDSSKSVGGELEKLGMSLNDVNNGNVQIKYNVSAGINPDLSRENAAGWVAFDKTDSNFTVNPAVHRNVVDEASREE